MGDEKAADHAAVEAMRAMLSTIEFDGRVVIGEGERDEAPMLYIGEKVGKGGKVKIDIALDPLEGTTLTAKAMANALAIIGYSNEQAYRTITAQGGPFEAESRKYDIESYGTWMWSERGTALDRVKMGV